MAQLRLAFGVAALLALAACTSADAQTPPPVASITPPAGWTQLPAMATAIADAAKAGGATVRTANAWGELARGCYAVSISLEGGGATSEVILGGLAGIPEVGEAGQFTVTTVQKPEQNNGVLQVGFSRPGYVGRLRVAFNKVGLDALACFANDRERDVCEAACTNVLKGLP